MAYLVDILFDYYNVKLLGFDVVFSEPDSSRGVELLEKMASGPLQKDTDFLSTLETMRPQLSYDDMFAKSLKNRPVVLGYVVSHIAEKTPEVGIRGVTIFAKAFMSIPAQQAAKTTRPLMPAAAPAVLVTRSLPNKG